MALEIETVCTLFTHIFHIINLNILLTFTQFELRNEKTRHKMTPHAFTNRGGSTINWGGCTARLCNEISEDYFDALVSPTRHRNERQEPDKSTEKLNRPRLSN